MWTCPLCQQKFFNTNQSHSCGKFTVSDFLAGKSNHAIELFNHFLSSYKKIGAYELHPVKTRVALLVKMRFAAVNVLGKDFLKGHLVLTKSYPSDMVHKIDNLGNRFFVHHFYLRKLSDLSPKFIRLMRMAYQTGQRLHVEQKGRP